MSSQSSANSSSPFPMVSHISLDVPTARHDQRLAYIHSRSNGSAESRSPFHHPQAGSSVVGADGSVFVSTIDYRSSPRSLSSSGSSVHYLNEALTELPPSSTPDLLPPNDDTFSPHVPLSQEFFANRLHTLLQAILDQECDEQESSPDCSTSQASQDEDHEWVMVSRDVGGETRRIALQEDLYEDADQGSSTFDISSETSLSFSRTKRLQLENLNSDTTLTHRNKRKHDFSYGFSESFSDGDTTDVDDGDEQLPNRKKARMDTASTASVSTTFSYQTSETASSRKLRSLSSATTSFGSAESTVVNSPSPFLHPIIHPPPNTPHVPKSKPEVAEARIKLLLQRETYYRIQDGLPPGPFEPSDFCSDEHDNLFGIEPRFRRTVVKWILEVLPPSYLSSQDLHQHLKYSEETRFHAMYLFTRFFLRLSECGVRCDEKPETKSMKAARVEITWHVAVSCLAISTKFYHDFLFPLNPIYSRHFLAIAPRYISHDQFERIQRDVLDAFDYEVHGVTPHAFFEELWDAVPSLQNIMRSRRTRAKTRDEMWDLLQIAALECDITRFPVSLLTAAALIESILITLVYEYEVQDRSCHNDKDLRASLKKNCNNAREEIRPVAQEISKLLGIAAVRLPSNIEGIAHPNEAQTDLETCRHWLAAITSK